MALPLRTREHMRRCSCCSLGWWRLRLLRCFPTRLGILQRDDGPLRCVTIYLAAAAFMPMPPRDNGQRHSQPPHACHCAAAAAPEKAGGQPLCHCPPV